MRFANSRYQSPLSDEELVLQYRNNDDRESLAVLFDRYSHLVFGLCLKYLKNEEDGKDAVLQLFEKLMRDLRKHDIAHFKSWLYMVSRNHCLMLLRERQSKNKKEAVLEEETQLTEPLEMGTEMAEDREARLNDLEAAIQRLKPEQRACIELFYLQKKCYSEVSEITGYTLKQVKSYIQNGKRNLRIIMTNHETTTT